MQTQKSIHTISAARLQDEIGEELVVRPAGTYWISPVVDGGLFTLIALFLLFASRSTFLLAFVPISIAIFFVTHYPLSTSLTFDFRSNQITYKTNYLVHRPRHVEARLPLSQISRISLRPVPAGMGHTADLVMADGSKIVLEFGNRFWDAERLVQRLASFSRTEAASALNPPQASAEAAPSQTTAIMYSQLRSWGFWLLIMGVAQMVARQGFSPWGALLIGIGAASFFLREPPTFMIYATTIAWAGLTNLIDGDGLWKAFALLQGVWAYQLFRQFLRFQRAESRAVQDSKDVSRPISGQEFGRARRLFPGLALTLGGTSLIGTVVGIGGLFLNAMVIHNLGINPVLAVVEITAVYAGILGLATGLAGWLAAYPLKWASIVGCIAGALALVIQIGILLLAKS